MAVVGRAVEHPKLVGVTIEEDELVPVVSADDQLADLPEEAPVSAEDLSGRAFVLREEGSATRRAAEQGLRSAGVKARVAMELGSNAAVTGAVAAGAGVGIVPKRTIASQSTVRVLNVGGLSLRRPFVLVVERGRALSPAAEAFVALCKGKE